MIIHLIAPRITSPRYNRYTLLPNRQSYSRHYPYLEVAVERRLVVVVVGDPVDSTVVVVEQLDLVGSTEAVVGTEVVAGIEAVVLGSL